MWLMAVKVGIADHSEM